MPGPKKRSDYNYTKFDVTTIPDMSAFVIFGLLKDQLSEAEKT